VLKHDDLIGLPWGSQVFSHNGSPFFLLPPTLADLVASTKRITQILYPKDIGFLFVMMGIGPGQHILEAGTGSGALTSAFAYAVGPEGHVTSYEVREPMQALARSNLSGLGMLERVDLKLRDIGEGFDEVGVDALFLDVPNPWDYLSQVRSALRPGGAFACILPTSNQVQRVLSALREADFAFLEVCETLLRWYKADPLRFRPVDRMVGHTGFLIFGRPVLVGEGPQSRQLLEEVGLVDDETEDGGSRIDD
jgi:tRNA (adenine57-N1/adenine58-N1)-methyltransferase